MFYIDACVSVSGWIMEFSLYGNIIIIVYNFTVKVYV